MLVALQRHRDARPPLARGKYNLQTNPNEARLNTAIRGLRWMYVVVACVVGLLSMPQLVTY